MCLKARWLSSPYICICTFSDVPAQLFMGPHWNRSGSLSGKWIKKNPTSRQPPPQFPFPPVNFLPRLVLDHGVGVGISGGDEKRDKNNLVFQVDCHVRLFMQGFITVSGKKLIFEGWEESILAWHESLWRCFSLSVWMMKKNWVHQFR